MQKKNQHPTYTLFILCAMLMLLTSLAFQQTDPVHAQPHAPQNSLTWGTQRVVSEPTFELQHDAMVVDNQGQLHLVYGKDHLYHAKLVEGNWNTSIIDPGWSVGRTASLAVDNSGNLHVAYTDDHNEQVKYRAYNGSHWSNATVVADADIKHVAIAVTSSGLPRIVYNLWERTDYAVFDGTDWQVQAVEGGESGVYFGNGVVAIAIDGQDQSHITYPASVYDGSGTSSQVRYATPRSTRSWNIQTIASAYRTCCILSLYSSIAIDDNDYPHIAFDNEFFAQLSYTHFDGVTWATSQIDAAGANPSLTLDSQNQPTVTYQGGFNTNREAYIATLNDGSWGKTQLTANSTARSTSVFDSGTSTTHYVLMSNDQLFYGQSNVRVTSLDLIDTSFTAGTYVDMVYHHAAPHLAYLTSSGGIEYAYLDGGQWKRETVENDPRATYATVAIAFAQTSNKPCVAYQRRDIDTSIKQLRLACQEADTWTHEVADTLNELAGVDMDLAFFGDNPHIAFIEGPRSTSDQSYLKYAYKSAGSWQVDSTLWANGGWMFQGVSLAVDNSEQPHISFYTEGFDLMYLAKTTSWQWAVLKEGGSSDTVVTVDSSGNPTVVAGHSDGLFVHVYDGTTWQEQQILTLQYPSKIDFVVDSQGKPHLSYTDDGALHYATIEADGQASNWLTASWTTQQVDTLIAGSEHNALVVTDTDNPLIAYYDSNNGDLKFTFNQHVATVSASGGTLDAYGLAHFDFPAGAFSDDVVISMTVTQPQTTPVNGIGIYYDITANYEASGGEATLEAGQTYTVSIQYDEAAVPAGTDEADLALFYWDGNTWQREPTSTVNTATNTITATPNHFSLWAALSEQEYSVYIPIVIR